jgi:hypothetical protein
MHVYQVGVVTPVDYGGLPLSPSVWFQQQFWHDEINENFSRPRPTDRSVAFASVYMRESTARVFRLHVMARRGRRDGVPPLSVRDRLK